MEFYNKWNSTSLILRIVIGLIIGVMLAVFIPDIAAPISIFGSLFVGALKAVAPVLVFFLVMSAISSHKAGQKTNMKSIVVLYLFGTFMAAVVAVIGSFIFSVELSLVASVDNMSPPEGVSEVLKALLMNAVDNPVSALMNANYIGVLTWSILLGLALKNASENTKTVISNFSDALSQIVRWVISFAPFGIAGLVFDAIATSGLEALKEYGQLIFLLVGSMVFMALVVNPLIVYAG